MLKSAPRTATATLGLTVHLGQKLDLRPFVLQYNYQESTVNLLFYYLVHINILGYCMQYANEKMFRNELVHETYVVLQNTTVLFL